MKTICQEKDCKKKATVDFGPTKLCNDHYIQIAYDMIPLILKGDSK